MAEVNLTFFSLFSLSTYASGKLYPFALLSIAMQKKWLKSDQEAFKLETSCVAEGLLILFTVFIFIFNIKYPAELNLVNVLLERLIGLKKEMRTNSSRVNKL